MLQQGNGYTLSFNDGDYEHWTDEEKNLFFFLVTDAWKKFREIKEAEKDRGYAFRKQA